MISQVVASERERAQTVYVTAYTGLQDHEIVQCYELEAGGKLRDKGESPVQVKNVDIVLS